MYSHGSMNANRRRIPKHARVFRQALRLLTTGGQMARQLVRWVRRRGTRMTTDESISAWLQALNDLSHGHSRYQRAAQAVYHRYVDRLIGLARKKLASHRRRMVDEEDIAHAVLEDLFQGICGGRFARLADQHDLWQVLVMLTDRRVIDQIRRDTGQKRGQGKVRGESVFEEPGESRHAPGGIDQVASLEPTPEFAAELLEELQWRLKQLEQVVKGQSRGDPESLKKIAMLRLQRYTNKEIAQKLGCVERTVDRKIGIIRQIWSSGHEKKSAE